MFWDILGTEIAMASRRFDILFLASTRQKAARMRVMLRLAHLNDRAAHRVASAAGDEMQVTMSHMPLGLLVLGNFPTFWRF